MKIEKYKNAQAARRALRDIEHAIKNAAIEAVHEHRATMLEAGMEEYVEKIIDEFWNNRFESIESAKAELDIRMKAQSKVRFWGDRLMSILKLTMNATAKAKKKLYSIPSACEVPLITKSKMEVRNSNQNQSISIWQIVEN